MFARCNVRVLESILFHELEEYSVVHYSAEGTLKSEYVVYIFRFEMFAYSHIMMCVERPSYMFMWERNPYAVSLKTPSDSDG